jgi:hypothetical protein
MQMPDTVVHERTDSSSSAGMIVGIVAVLLVAVMAFFFIFGGAGRTTSGPGQTNVNVPSQQAQPQAPAGGPNIQVPRQIDVNLNQGGQQAPAPGN